MLVKSSRSIVFVYIKNNISKGNWLIEAKIANDIKELNQSIETKYLSE